MRFRNLFVALTIALLAIFQHSCQFFELLYRFQSRLDTPFVSVRRNRSSSKSKVPRPKPALGSDSPPPALPVKTRQTLRRRAAVPPPEYDIPDESYDTIENYPMRPPPIPPKVCTPPPIPPRFWTFLDLSFKFWVTIKIVRFYSIVLTVDKSSSNSNIDGDFLIVETLAGNF